MAINSLFVGLSFYIRDRVTEKFLQRFEGRLCPRNLDGMADRAFNAARRR